MVKKHEDELHSAIPKLIEDLEQHKISRREFLRFATLLGVSAVTAYGLAGLTAPRKAMARMEDSPLWGMDRGSPKRLQ